MTAALNYLHSFGTVNFQAGDSTFPATILTETYAALNFAWNENPKPFVWTKTAEQILERLAGYCATVNQATQTP